MRFSKGASCTFFSGPCYTKSNMFGFIGEVQHGVKNITSQTMLKHGSTESHKIAVEKTIPTCAFSSHSCRMSIWQIRCVTQKLFQVSMLWVQCSGGQWRAKQGVSQLAMSHQRDTIQPCFSLLPPSRNRTVMLTMFHSIFEQLEDGVLQRGYFCIFWQALAVWKSAL